MYRPDPRVPPCKTKSCTIRSNIWSLLAVQHYKHAPWIPKPKNKKQKTNRNLHYIVKSLWQNTHHEQASYAKNIKKEKKLKNRNAKTGNFNKKVRQKPKHIKHYHAYTFGPKKQKIKINERIISYFRSSCVVFLSTKYQNKYQNYQYKQEIYLWYKTLHILDRTWCVSKDIERFSKASCCFFQLEVKFDLKNYLRISFDEAKIAMYVFNLEFQMYLLWFLIITVPIIIVSNINIIVAVFSIIIGYCLHSNIIILS